MFSELYIVSIIVIIIIIYWGHQQSEKGMGTPILYIVQTYLYIIISLLIVALITQQLSQREINIDHRHMIMSFLISIFSIFIMHLWSNDSIVMKHVFWVIFVVCMSVIMSPIVNLVSTARMNQNIIIVVITMVLLSVIAYIDKDNMFPSMLKYLVLGLFIMILVELGDLFFFSQTNAYQGRHKIYDIIVIMMFVFFVLADTQSLKVKALQCGHSACIDYPVESTKIFLDIINLFARVTSLRSQD